MRFVSYNTLSQTDLHGVRRRTDNWHVALSAFFPGITDSSTVTAILGCSAPPSADSSTVTAILACSAPPSADSSTVTAILACSAPPSVVKSHHILFSQHIDVILLYFQETTIIEQTGSMYPWL